MLIDVNLEHWKQREREKEREVERQKARDRERYREIERERDRMRQKEEREKYIVQQAAQELAAVEAEPIDSDSDMDDNHFSPAPPEEEAPSDHSEPAQVIKLFFSQKQDMLQRVFILLYLCFSGRRCRQPMKIPVILSYPIMRSPHHPRFRQERA